MLLPAILILLQAQPTFRDFGVAFGNDSACWVDVDNDGWVDLIAGGVVWHNDAGKGFTKVADVGQVVAADFDNDGYVDLFSWSRMKLYRNTLGDRKKPERRVSLGIDTHTAGHSAASVAKQGIPFRNVAANPLPSPPPQAGEGISNLHAGAPTRAEEGIFQEVKLPDLPPTSSRGACWGDFDGDGFVDLYIGGFEDWDKQITYPSFILMNQGGKSFKLVWTEAKHRTRGVTACDFDRDGDIDVYASNYRLQPNDLWVNDGKSRFRQAAEEFGVVATSPGFEGGHSIGAAWGDFDNDGEIDLFAGNFAHVDDRGDQPKSRFYRNLGKTKGYHFEDKGTCGVWYQESYASPAAGDFDNDGRLDLYFTTVYANASFGRHNYPVLYRNESNFQFKDVTREAGVAEQPATYQAAWADFNHDGYLDLATAGRLFVNQGKAQHWLEVRLRGDGKKVNRSAIGAQARIRIGKQTLTRQVEAGTGEGNQNDLTLHFGLGDHKDRVDVEIEWPNRKKQKLHRAAIDHIVDVKYP